MDKKGLTFKPCVYCGELVGWDDEPNPRCIPECEAGAEISKMASERMEEAAKKVVDDLDRLEAVERAKEAEK